MKSLAMLIILALHGTGLWSHLPEPKRAEVVARATGTVAARDATSRYLPQYRYGPLPIRSSNQPLALSATSAIAMDRSTATVLYSKNVSARLPIASITKLVTSLVVMSSHNPDDLVTISKLPDYPKEAETLGLVAGDQFPLRNLLEAALVPSANDAADALAIYDAGSVTKFAAKMNAKMAEWSISDTRFSSASGLKDSDNYASAAALAKIASLALNIPSIRQTVSQANGTISSRQGRTYNFTSTNILLASGQFYGIKTGYTQAAGECFVGLTRINGHEVITVVLGSENRFGATTTLTNWIENNWKWL